MRFRSDGEHFRRTVASSCLDRIFGPEGFHQVFLTSLNARS